MTLISINPYSGKTISEHEEDSTEIVESKISNADRAFSSWRFRPMEERTRVVKRLGEVLLEEKEKLSRIASEEMGKPIAQARAEIEKCSWLCEHYGECAEEYLRDDYIETEARKSWVSYEPLGVILGIMPWNFPYWQVFRYAVPTLLAGNAVLLKHAGNVQNCAEAIEKLWKKAGLPDGLYSNLALAGSNMNSVIEDERVKAVSLTGSEKAGKAVAAVAGANIKKCVLELGGSNAFIVLKDADIDNVISTALPARIQNNGQSCIAAKRFIVQRDISEEFISAFAKKLEIVKAGDPLEEDTDLGPLARKDLAEELHDQVNASISRGAKCILGGSLNEAMYEPTLLVNVEPGMRVFDEETFGPVAAVTIADSEEHAVDLANQTKFGLGVSIFTQNEDLAVEMGKKIKDGAVFINEMVKSHPKLPFGGTGISGYGRELGPLGIKEFVNAKTYYSK
jgi:succinate-semialdehyde dehydrogenase/glutarate-semialdehyde dehydrogenase